MRKLCVLDNGMEVYAWERDGSFYDEADLKLIVVRSSYIRCMDMTRDQFLFERDLKGRTHKGDYSKHDNLMYQDSMMSAFYKMWREAKGLPIDDEYYPLPTVTKDTRKVQYYSDNKYKGD